MCKHVLYRSLGSLFRPLTFCCLLALLLLFSFSLSLFLSLSFSTRVCVCVEFGEELVLQRTPQTLTLVGELEDDEEDFEEDFVEDDEDLSLDDNDDDDDDDEEEVEVLLSFECNNVEYHLVRLLDPILLVGKSTPPRSNDNDNNNLPEDPTKRYLLTAEESANVMPLLEDLFLEYHGNDIDTTFS